MKQYVINAKCRCVLNGFQRGRQFLVNWNNDNNGSDRSQHLLSACHVLSTDQVFYRYLLI